MKNFTKNNNKFWTTIKCLPPWTIYYLIFHPFLNLNRRKLTALDPSKILKAFRWMGCFCWQLFQLFSYFILTYQIQHFFCYIYEEQDSTASIIHPFSLSILIRYVGYAWISTDSNVGGETKMEWRIFNNCWWFFHCWINCWFWHFFLPPILMDIDLLLV